MKRIALATIALICLLSGSLGLFVAPNTVAAADNATGVRGDYFSDANLTTLALSRIDATANFNWQSGAPAAGLPKDNFTVRWSGQVVPRFSETYTFRITADDGVRLWING